METRLSFPNWGLGEFDWNWTLFGNQNGVWETGVWRLPNLMKLGFVKLQSEWSLKHWSLYGYKPQFHFNLNENPLWETLLPNKAQRVEISFIWVLICWLMKRGTSLKRRFGSLWVWVSQIMWRTGLVYVIWVLDEKRKREKEGEERREVEGTLVQGGGGWVYPTRWFCCCVTIGLYPLRSRIIEILRDLWGRYLNCPKHCR